MDPSLIDWSKYLRAWGFTFVNVSARFKGFSIQIYLLISFDSKESRRRGTVGLNRKTFCSWRVEMVVRRPFESTRSVRSGRARSPFIDIIYARVSDMWIARSAVYVAARISATANENEHGFALSYTNQSGCKRCHSSIRIVHQLANLFFHSKMFQRLRHTNWVLGVARVGLKVVLAVILSRGETLGNECVSGQH